MIKDILQQLSFGHRLVLYRLVIALMISAVVYYYFYVPKPGERMFERAQKAMQSATSWKLEFTQSDPAQSYKVEYLVEVQCPSSARTTQHLSGAPGGVAQDWTHITLNLGGATYEYINPQKGWTRAASGFYDPAAICGRMAQGEETGLLPPLMKWRRQGFIDKKEVRDTGSGQCQDWKVVVPGGRNSPSHTYSVCLGVDDLLPRFREEGGVQYRYYDWNVPIEFTAPQIGSGTGPAS